jgi:hypothetical protein
VIGRNLRALVDAERPGENAGRRDPQAVH